MSEPFMETNSSLLSLKKWEQIHPQLKVGFTSRRNGISDPPYHSFNLGLHVKDDEGQVLLNRKHLAQMLKFSLDHWVCSTQVHHTDIHIVKTLKDRGKGAYALDSALYGFDGLITKKKGVLLTAYFADCVPLFFFDPTTEMIGIAHAGWKGTVKGIGIKMIDSFKRLGVNPKHLLVGIGPSISKERYIVNYKVVRKVKQPYLKSVIKPIGCAQYLLDLKQLNIEILLQSGILRHNIYRSDYCTYDYYDLFFSHRRDGENTGRMMGYIGYKE